MRGIEQIPWVYDAFCALMERGGFGRWRRWLAGGAHGRTLDIGCGTGRNLPLLPADARTVALDPSPDAIRRAGARAPGVPRVIARAEDLPFRDATFDTVLSGLVFCSVPDAARGLAEVRRVLKPGGELRMIEHVRASTPWRARLQDGIQPAWTRVTGGCHPNRDTEAAVARAGFTIDDRRAEGTLRRFRAFVR
jgi:ubiquinone/menaquinone biosynthesis C-methylase UbiE